ncbi:hypothetical protein DBV39_06210 [Orrella marina]|uniref:Uncharacterized protein n=1 Tax=Orrella marina TaxID=2163011 RepID=A0A2R4XHR9_9BURK|nr:hypothetical protein DBV39_06210 [Orrella marina]
MGNSQTHSLFPLGDRERDFYLGVVVSATDVNEMGIWKGPDDGLCECGMEQGPDRARVLVETDF